MRRGAFGKEMMIFKFKELFKGTRRADEMVFYFEKAPVMKLSYCAK